MTNKILESQDIFIKKENIKDLKGLEMLINTWDWMLPKIVWAAAGAMSIHLLTS